MSGPPEEHVRRGRRRVITLVVAFLAVAVLSFAAGTALTLGGNRATGGAPGPVVAVDAGVVLLPDAGLRVDWAELTPPAPAPPRPAPSGSSP